MEPVLILSLIIFISSYALTWILKLIYHKTSVLDIPNERSSHSVPTPRGGGLAIVVTWYAGITFLFLFHRLDPKLYYALLSGALLAVISLVDDFVDLNPSIRFITQFVTSIIAFLILGGFEPINIGAFVFDYKIILYPLVIVGMVWFINLYNFLDGIDGYASVEAISISLIFLFLTGSPVLPVLIACTLGFLIWNWPKAKIFMGDVGSTQLGFIIIVMGIYFHNRNVISFIEWIILLSPYWFDATLTLFLRWRNKEKLSKAHCKHIYQRLVQSGFSQRSIDLLLVSLNLILFIFVMVSRFYKFLQIPLLLLTLLMLYLIALYTDKRKPFEKVIC